MTREKLIVSCFNVWGARVVRHCWSEEEAQQVADSMRANRCRSISVKPETHIDWLNGVLPVMGDFDSRFEVQA